MTSTMRLVLMEETSLRACSVVISGVFSMGGGEVE